MNTVQNEEDMDARIKQLADKFREQIGGLYLTTHDIANLLKFHPGTILRYTKEGLLVAEQDFGTTAGQRYTHEEVARWAIQRTMRTKKNKAIKRSLAAQRKRLQESL